jgi:hypothetical protein
MLTPYRGAMPTGRADPQLLVAPAWLAGFTPRDGRG